MTPVLVEEGGVGLLTLLQGNTHSFSFLVLSDADEAAATFASQVPLSSAQLAGALATYLTAITDVLDGAPRTVHGSGVRARTPVLAGYTTQA